MCRIDRPAAVLLALLTESGEFEDRGACAPLGVALGEQPHGALRIGEQDGKCLVNAQEHEADRRDRPQLDPSSDQPGEGTLSGFPPITVER